MKTLICLAVSVQLVSCKKERLTQIFSKSEGKWNITRIVTQKVNRNTQYTTYVTRLNGGEVDFSNEGNCLWVSSSPLNQTPKDTAYQSFPYFYRTEYVDALETYEATFSTDNSFNTTGNIVCRIEFLSKNYIEMGCRELTDSLIVTHRYFLDRID